MKKIQYTLFLFVLLCNSQLVHSQDVAPTTLTKNEIQNLSNLGKIWGFLKYYHPNVAKGNFNWDEQLLTIMPKIEKASTKEEVSKIYIDWINSLGVIKECKSCKKSSSKDYFEKNFNLSWSQNTEVFSNELSEKLKYIEDNRFQGKNYYVSATPVNTIVMTNEPEYKNFEFPDENYRLLSLFKFWNVIEYFYPYKYLTDQNWDEVLSEMIPKFKDAKNASEYHLAMLEATVKLDDSHAVFITKLTNDYFGRKFIPEEVKIIDNKAIVTGFSNDSLSKINDLRIGDIIEKVDGKPIMEVFNGKLKYIPGSNFDVKLRSVNYTITNGSTDSVKLSINRNDIITDKIISRYPGAAVYSNKKIKPEKYKIIEGNIGYVNMGVLLKDDVDEMMKKFKDTKAIIFDIRNYPNGTMYLISRYLNSEKKEFVKITEPDLTYPGKFIWEKNLNLFCGTSNKDNYKGKIVLLVNEETQSHAEFTVMCFQTANNVTTIGSQTAGADGNVTNAEFIGGYKTMMTGLGVYYPDGTETQRKGVKIDVEVKPTIEGIRSGKDEVLEKALELVK